MLDNRTRILNAASQLFLQGGFAALSVRAIANRAGLSTIGIYSHFDGKQGILDALYIEGFERVAEALDVPATDTTPRERILIASSAYLQVAEQYSAHYRLIFGEQQQVYRPSEAAQEVGAKAFQRLTEIVGALFPADTSLLQRQMWALEIWAMVHGFVGLRSHAVSQFVKVPDWRELTLIAVQRHLDVLLAAKA